MSKGFFESLPEAGTVFVDVNGNTYIKIKEYPHMHIEGMFLWVETGEIVHASNISGYVRGY